MRVQSKTLELPSVAYSAAELNLSANYFGDLIKKETGKSAQEYILLKVIDVAKEKIFDREKSISEVAYELGFKYPQHFTRVFKQRTGMSPNDYRNLN
ncbi:AraC family transcriptional regulator [Pedobacter sp. N36a]|uniref:helix-turn-helix domain-containing protein n=1 Tax=Pedobacter sp. N36a TaxID=2767996 RepID=UPI00165725F5|nr:AraC family transcriptional regulator [Pedobacter sp. N36a]